MEHTQDLISALALCRIRGIGIQKLRILLKEFHTPDNVFKASSSALNALMHQLSPAIIKSILAKETFHEAETISKQCASLGITLLFYTDTRYPEQVRGLSVPPLVLYAMGRLDALSSAKKVVCIAGTRKMSVYGSRVIEDLCVALSQLDGMELCVLGGLGDGVERTATEAALKHGLQTLTVLPGGMDKPYPSQTPQSRLEQLKETGCILTEHPCGVGVLKHAFIQRNYLMAGLSHQIVLIESGIQGGSLGLARYGLRENREVWAVPGSIYSKSAEGCHALIKDEYAQLLQGPDALCQALVGEPASQKSKPSPASQQEVPSSVSKPNRSIPTLEGAEKSLFTHLSKQSQALHIDTLSRALQISVQDIHPILLALELKRLIVSLPGHYYKVEASLLAAEPAS